MNLDKFNKMIWTTIGLIILGGIALIVGGIAVSSFYSNRYRPEGVSLPKADKSESIKFETKTVYEMPLVIEGSDFLVVPVSIKKVPHGQRDAEYLLSKSYSSASGNSGYSKMAYMNYNYFRGPCHNLLFIHKKTGETVKLLDVKAYISAVYFPDKKYSEEKTQSTFILLAMGKEDTSGDGLINDKDAMVGYTVGLDGKSVTQVTPSGTNMGNWRYDHDSKKLFIETTQDENGDKKFTDEDFTKTLGVDIDSPAIGRDLVTEEVKQAIEKIIQA